jgi:ATP-dependent Clp protease ATP-binding subunit ClpB
LRKFFKIEFLNRIDEIIIFNPLSINEIKKIVKLLLKKTQDKLAQKGFKVDFSDALLEKISQEGFDQIYGARPLRRFIQNNIENVIAKKILNGEIKKDHAYLVDVFKDEIVFLTR